MGSRHAAGEGTLSCSIWQATIPLARRLITPVSTLSSVHAVVLRLSDTRGEAGSAYIYAMTRERLDDLTKAAKRYFSERPAKLSTLLESEHLPLDAGEDGYVWRSAISLISMAAWDLLGRQTGKTCAELWGSQRLDARLDVYASGLFLDIDEPALEAEAAEFRRLHYRFLKMRGGLSAAEDASRYEVVSRVFPEPHSIAIDFVQKSSVPHTREFLQRITQPPLWVEDPMVEGALGAFGAEASISAGENCTSLEQLLELWGARVRKLIIDVQHIGGPLRFLEAARCLHGLGASLGSHVFVHESTHLLACLPKSLPVEMLDWWNPIFNETPRPDAHGQLGVQGPGLGRTLNLATLERHGTPVT